MRRANAPMSAIIADDEELAREELRYLLNEIGDVEVVATAANGLEALELIRKLDPALAVLDIQMPGLDGLSVVRRLQELQAALDPDLFWRAHRSFVVNVNRIREVVPWFKSSYQLRMDDKKASEIPVSRMQSKRLREMLNL